MDLLKEFIDDYSDTPIMLGEAIISSVKQLHLQSKGKNISTKDAYKFITKNSSLTKASAINALASYKQYKTNKRNVITLFAKKPYEKKLVKSVVDALIKSKEYKILHTKYADGGKYYELKRIKGNGVY